MKYYVLYDEKGNAAVLTENYKEGYTEISEEEFERLSDPYLYYQEQLAAIKTQLAATDYKALKYAEGWISEEEYAPIKAERQALRNKINELEGATDGSGNPASPAGRDGKGEMNDEESN